MLAIVGIKTYIDERLNKLETLRVASADEVMMYLTSVMRGEQKEEVLMLRGKGCQELVKKDISVKDRLKAAELLGKRYGIFTEKLELQDSDIKINIIRKQ